MYMVCIYRERQICFYLWIYLSAEIYHIILAPGASEEGVGVAALAPLPPDAGGLRMNPARTLVLSKLRTGEPSARIGHPTLSKIV